jgi:hypothetical protein
MFLGPREHQKVSESVSGKLTSNSFSGFWTRLDPPQSLYERREASVRSAALTLALMVKSAWKEF